MQEYHFIIVLTQYAMYATALASYCLKFIIPNPGELRKMLEVEKLPHWYMVGYNIFRWVSGNDAWKDKSPSPSITNKVEQ